ncbi:MAG: alpha/beta hydrolase family protein [Planctomycetota bacterium]
MLHHIAAALSLILLPVSVAAQERVQPKESRGGKAAAELWAGMPDEARRTKFPEWTLPRDLKTWETHTRPKTLQIVRDCLGDLPPRPKDLQVKIVAREEFPDYTLERFEFHNGVDGLVPGILLIPKNRVGRLPAMIGLHGYGGSSATICTDEKNAQCFGPLMAKNGFVVAAIDSYFCGARAPGSKSEHRGLDEGTLFKLHHLMGRSLWGMMIRDQQILIDYLQTRTEIDPARIGVSGMSMGGTGSWWLAAVDDRVQAAVCVAGFTRYEELFAHGNFRLHGIYYWVPGLLRRFDTEAVYALIAPRPFLALSGDRDGGLPLTGIEILEKKLGAVYQVHGRQDRFRSIVYANTAHEYLPEMQQEMAAWMVKHLQSK